MASRLSATFVNSQLVCLLSVWIFNHVIFICRIICFIIWFHWPRKATWSIKIKQNYRYFESCDFPTRVFLKHKSKMNSGRCVLKFLWRIVGEKSLMRFRVKPPFSNFSGLVLTEPYQNHQKLIFTSNERSFTRISPFGVTNGTCSNLKRNKHNIKRKPFI